MSKMTQLGNEFADTAETFDYIKLGMCIAIGTTLGEGVVSVVMKLISLLS